LFETGLGVFNAGTVAHKILSHCFSLLSNDCTGCVTMLHAALRSDKQGNAVHRNQRWVRCGVLARRAAHGLDSPLEHG
jgi:hypothetical protein